MKYVSANVIAVIRRYQGGVLHLYAECDLFPTKLN